MTLKALRAQSGQFTLEAVLLLAVVVIVTTTILSQFRSNEILASFIQKPWKILAGMVESGVWDVETKAAKKHPISRRLSYDPKGAQ